MKPYLILIPIFIFTLLQGSFLSLNLVLMTILVFTAFNSSRQSLWVAFTSGLLLDLAQGTIFGLSSLLFLVLAFLLLLYSKRFEPTHLFFLPFFVFFSALLYSLVIWQQIYLLSSLVLFSLTILVLFILKFFPLERTRGLKLRT